MPEQRWKTDSHSNFRICRNYLYIINLILICAFGVLASVGFHCSFGATAAQGGTVNQTKSSPRGIPFNGTVKFFNTEQSFVVLEGKSERKFFVTAETKIKIDGVEGKLDQIEAGKYIGGYARKDGEDRWVAATINIYSNRTKTNAPASVKSSQK